MTIALTIFALFAIVAAALQVERRDPYALAFWLYLHATAMVAIWLRAAGVVA